MISIGELKKKKGTVLFELLDGYPGFRSKGTSQGVDYFCNFTQDKLDAANILFTAKEAAEKLDPFTTLSNNDMKLVASVDACYKLSGDPITDNVLIKDPINIEPNPCTNLRTEEKPKTNIILVDCDILVSSSKTIYVDKSANSIDEIKGRPVVVSVDIYKYSKETADEQGYFLILEKENTVYDWVKIENNPNNITKSIKRIRYYTPFKDKEKQKLSIRVTIILDFSKATSEGTYNIRMVKNLNTANLNYSSVDEIINTQIDVKFSQGKYATSGNLKSDARVFDVAYVANSSTVNLMATLGDKTQLALDKAFNNNNDPETLDANIQITPRPVTLPDFLMDSEGNMLLDVSMLDITDSNFTSISEPQIKDFVRFWKQRVSMALLNRDCCRIT